MDSAPSWLERLRRGLSNFWHTEDSRVAAVRDVVLAGAIVMLLLGVVWGYTGQRFPSQAPLVVVESGSMMHGRCMSGIYENCFNSQFENSPFGRFGTIDPGDLVFVKRVDSLDEVEDAFGSGKRGGYGGHGDVLVYKPDGSSRSTPIIHRAMLELRVDRDNCLPNAATNPCRFIVPAACDARFGDYAAQDGWEKYCTGSSDPITLTLERHGLRLNLVNYPCSSASTCFPMRSGFLTKGDNNPNMDQPGIAAGPVELSWIVGKARGEIPWFGLIKLALFGNENYKCRPGQGCSDPNGPDRAAQWTIFRATAPWDIWVALFLAVGVLVSLPVAMDFAINQVKRRWGR